jgi:uncharacterized protein (TIGR02677 family)
MQIQSKIQKPITEVKYLNGENCYRYRPILRYFYIQYEKMKYWMYKDEVFDMMKESERFQDYTLDMLGRDLDQLVQWGNIVPVQDTSRVSTAEEFKNKKFRYQLSDYSVEIERFTIKLENLFIEGASLEPTLFERIKDAVLEISNLENKTLSQVGGWWRNLDSDFKRLNQNYQDYIRVFQSASGEEKMQAEQFIVYKDNLINYLREFVKELQKNAYIIEDTLRRLDKNMMNEVFKRLLQYEKSIPRIEFEVSESELKDTIDGKWKNFNQWFLGDGYGESEAARVLDITNEIIRKITRYAASIAESRSIGANRKEEYKKLARMFLSTEDMDDAHKLSAMVFGIAHSKHLKLNAQRQTESINSGIFEEVAHEIKVKPRVRTFRERNSKSSIQDKKMQKEKMRKKFIEKMQEEKNVLESFIKDNQINIKDLPVIESYVRVTLLKWISKAIGQREKIGKTDDGKEYTVILPENGEECWLECVDGKLYMPAYIIEFKKTKA